MVDAAAKMPSLLPDDSKTAAKPRLSTAALATTMDQASFAAVMPAIIKNCGGRREKYRASEN
jgi:hypothetical protein